MKDELTCSTISDARKKPQLRPSRNPWRLRPTLQYAVALRDAEHAVAKALLRRLIVQRPDKCA